MSEMDAKRGLYSKYSVRRVDGSSDPGGKHEHCMYYVLDLEHDKHAKAALAAYAKSCEKEYPKLAADLRGMVRPRRRYSAYFNTYFGNIAPAFGKGK